MMPRRPEPTDRPEPPRLRPMKLQGGGSAASRPDAAYFFSFGGAGIFGAAPGAPGAFGADSGAGL